MKNYYLKGALTGVIAIQIVLVGWSLYIGKIGEFFLIYKDISIVTGILTCLLAGWGLDRTRKVWLILWGPIVYEAGVIVYSLSSYLINGVFYPAQGFFFPIRSFLIDPFVFLTLVGVPLSLVIAYSYKKYTKPEFDR